MSDTPTNPETPEEPSRESLRVNPDSFEKMVDRSAGGPAYRQAIVVLKGVVAAVAVAAIIGVVVTLVALARIALVLDKLEDNAAEADRQREFLIECLTLSPKPGMELDEEDRVHECQIETEGLRTAAVGRIAATNIHLHECVEARAVDLRACIAAKEDGGPYPARQQP